MISISKLAVGIGMATVAALIAVPANAGCKRMQFLVNDYGKEGPTKDSQDLLDKHIAKWAAEQGIEKYTVGKKETTCELFLNLILFDEHTCTTRATVCWGGDKLPGEQQAKSKKPAADKAAESADGAKVEPAKAEGADKPADALADAVTTPADAATPPAGAASDVSATAEAVPPAEAAAAGATPAETAPVETGTIALTNKPGENSSAAAADPSISVTQRDAVAAATAAAERAAAAAERAAAAAERATAALNEHIAAEAEKEQAAKAEAPAFEERPAFTPPNAALVAPVQPTSKQ